MRDGDPRALPIDEKISFIIWNWKALVKELSEATDEVGWKPWATSRHFNYLEYMKELVDAFHFFMNLIIVAHAPSDSPEDMARTFVTLYMKKNQLNAERQDKGYDGISGKCHICHREFIADGVCPYHGKVTGR